MATFKLEIKTSFGSLAVSGNNELDVLNMLERLNEDDLGEINEKISTLQSTQVRDRLRGIVAMRKDGPVIITRKKMTHYEAIGIILYSLKNHQSSSKNIRNRLTASGMKIMVPARVHEMRKRGHIIKPLENNRIYNLSTKGKKWIEKEVLLKFVK